MRTPLVFLPLSLLALGFGFACAPSAVDTSESSEDESRAQDLTTATRMLNLLGGPDGKCVDCHTATPANIKGWGTAMKAVDTACLAAPGLELNARIDCLRDDPANRESSFSAHKLGLYAAGAAGAEFDALFTTALPDHPEALTTFKQRVKMPRAGDPISSRDWATLKRWVLRGMPQLDEAAAALADGGLDASADATASDGGADADAADAGPDCVDRTTPELAAHVARMKGEGWGARLADLRTPMYGCGAATNAVACLDSLPDLTDTMGAAGVPQKLRQLRDLGMHTNFWVRSSADGRYVGVGSSPSRIFDLNAPTTAKPIEVAASYDPFFLRSNDGFAYAGVNANGGIVLCQQSLLADVAGTDAPRVAMTEAKCTKVGSSVYESIGSALDGVTYFMTVGPHMNDDGGNSITHPLPASYGAPSRTSFTPMVNDGTAYKPQPSIQVDLPNEGDTMLSPSGLLAATRFAGIGKSKQAGFRVHLVNATPNGASYDINAPLAAEVCMKGGKPEMSFDERFLAAHQYVDHSEPNQATLPDGSSNIVVADLLTGKKYRITNMSAGQYALYPHFRADGWLYFLVRDKVANKELMVASDVVLRIAAQ